MEMKGSGGDSRLMIPRVLPAQQGGAVLLGPVHELTVQSQYSFTLTN